LETDAVEAKMGGSKKPAPLDVVDLEKDALTPQRGRPRKLTLLNIARLETDTLKSKRKKKKLPTLDSAGLNEIVVKKKRRRPKKDNSFANARFETCNSQCACNERATPNPSETKNIPKGQTTDLKELVMQGRSPDIKVLHLVNNTQTSCQSQVGVSLLKTPLGSLDFGESSIVIDLNCTPDELQSQRTLLPLDTAIESESKSNSKGDVHKKTIIPFKRT